MLQIVYFARIREALAMEGEAVEAQPDMRISQLLDILELSSERHAVVFADRSKLRFALDQIMVPPDALLKDARELAVFPPVTGG